MQSLPYEILDYILQYVHPTGTNLWRAAHEAGFPKDMRRKSNHEYLLRGPSLRFSGRPNPNYKDLRLVFPQYYSDALFHTVFLYPHIESFTRIEAISLSNLTLCVRRIVISLPFVTEKIISRFSPQHPTVTHYWYEFPDHLLTTIQRFPNLDTIIVLPSWDRRLHWMQGRPERILDLELALNPSWYGCRCGHPKCAGDNEHCDMVNLKLLLAQLNKLNKLQHLHVFNLGTEWLSFLQADDSNLPLDRFPISPASTVSLNFHNHKKLIRKAKVHSSSLHDLVYFNQVFHHLREFHLEHISAWHSAEVDLFSTVFDRRCFPQMQVFKMKSSDLQPTDYIYIFTAIRLHGGITEIIFEDVHSLCPRSNVGKRFIFASRTPRDQLQTLLCGYMENQNVLVKDIKQSWLRMFGRSGCLCQAED